MLDDKTAAVAVPCSGEVSVIIPAYNAAGTLAEAVGTVRAQTYQDLEVLIVDDGSTDETWRVAQALAAGWSKVRAFRAEHKGLAAARNLALREMRGQWIAPLDADDLWLPEKLQRCLAYLAAHPELSIVYTPMAPIRADGTPMAGHNKPCLAGRLTAELFESIFIHDPAAVFHRRVVEACGPFDESLPISVGHEFWLRVSTKFAFGLIDQPLALRRWSEQSASRRARGRGRQVKAAMLERFYFERGGQDLIARPAAMRRLSRVNYAAGKALLMERNFAAARRHLRKAIGFSPTCVKAYPFYLAGWLAGLFGR